MSSEQLKGHLDPLVLAILEEHPAHGYAIIESLRERSAGVFDLPEGTIYPALHRLERDGAVTSRRVAGTTQSHSGAPRTASLANQLSFFVAVMAFQVALVAALAVVVDTIMLVGVIVRRRDA